MRDPAQAAWTLLRFAPRPLTASQIIFDAIFPLENVRLSTVFSALDQWRDCGLITTAPTKPETFTMQEAAKKLRKPPQGSGGTAAAPARQRIWLAIKVLRRFDLIQLWSAADVNPRYAREVLNQLTRAGYLAQEAVGDGDPPRWRVIRPTGPHHPTIEYVRRRPVALRDRVTGERFDLATTIPFFLTSDINHVG
jgi:hypothetical protein